MQELLLGPMEEAWTWALAQPMQMQLLMAAGFVVVTTMFISSLMGMLNSKRPPCVAGLPLIGGFLKFVKVSDAWSAWSPERDFCKGCARS